MWSVTVMPLVIILVPIARPLVCAAVYRLSWSDRMVKLGCANIASIVARGWTRLVDPRLHAANLDADVADLFVETAEMDPTHADWRAMALETAWVRISGSASRPPRPYAAAAPTDLEPWGRCCTKQPA